MTWIAPLITLINSVIGIVSELKKPPDREAFTQEMHEMRRKRREALRIK